MVNINKVEPTWTYYKEIENIKANLIKLEANFNASIKNQESVFLNVMSNSLSDVKSDVEVIVNNLISNANNSNLSFKEECSTILSRIESFQKAIQIQLDDFDKEHNQKYIQIYNTLNTYKNQIERLHFDIIDNEDNVSITYTNPDGKLEYGAIKKVFPDNKSIVFDNNGHLSLNYNFNPQNFNIDNKNNIKVTGLSLNSGKYLNADKLNSDLTNATYNISSLTYKIEAMLKKLNNVNGYLASNNFKKATPTQDVLNNFAIECLSHMDNKVTVDLIPAGTKIKNTFDNHIWVFNRFSHNDGLTIHKWEDFGADTICIASNDGVHGLVTGSHDHFKAFVDINGVISINGLEEDFQDLLKSLSELNIQIKDMQSNYESRLLNLESRLDQLETRKNA